MRKLILLLSVMALMMPQTMKAQDNSPFFYSFHKKDNNPRITLDTTPDDIVKAVMDEIENGKELMMWEGTWMELYRRETDWFGNVHVTYCQKYAQDEPSEYQIVLHYRPDGSLYYKNGTLVFKAKETAQHAKGRKPESRISPERAAVIATGSPMSKTVWTIANHKGKPCDAYKVRDEARMQNVYVDAYSGEVLYTISLIHSFAPWDDVNGSAVTLSANTSYNGLQDLTVMQTDKGYILRDPERNIITVDATDVLADRDTTNLPKGREDQYRLLMDSCDDASFADEAELLNQKYTTNLRSFTIWLDPEMEKVPDSLKLEIFYADTDDNFVKDIVEMDVKNPIWTDDNGRRRCTITFEDHPNVNLFEYHNVVKVTINDEAYTTYDAVLPGNKCAYIMYKGEEETNVGCLFDVEVDARQLAIDVHWAIQNIYDMYEEYYGIKGCDGKGSQTVNIVNPGNNMPITNILPLNAFAAGDLIDSHGDKAFLMCYGAGGANDFKPTTCFDFTAHEFTHNVTSGCCNDLLYMNESGALNEALADCMAMVAEDYVYGEPTWLWSEKIVLFGDCARNFYDPWYSGSKDGKINDYWAQPKYYKGKYWVDYTQEDVSDNGGVHHNSGVFNHLFYLLCEGGMGLTNEKNETRDIYPIGIDRMKDILFQDMRYYNACLCSFAEIADNLLMAVEDFYCGNNEAISDLQKKLLDAYEHVGMRSDIFPTGVELVNLQSDRQTLYNLLGQPVGDDYKGVVVMNGKTVVTK